MKKRILAVVGLLLLVTVFACACTSNSVAEKLNKMAAEKYSCVKLQVTSKFSEDAVLTSTFVVNNSANTVEYNVEQFQTLDASQVPQGNKTVVSGVANVVGGKVQQTETALNLPLQQIVDLKWDFDVQYVGRVVTDTSLTASIANPYKFFGVQTFEGTDVGIVVNFADVLQNVQVTYTSSRGALVTLMVEYTK